MIRFIRIGDQICEGDDAFAFWDTVRDRFIEISGETVFTSIANFEDYAQDMSIEMQLPHLPRNCLERCRGFMKNAVPPLRKVDPVD